MDPRAWGAWGLRLVIMGFGSDLRVYDLWLGVMGLGFGFTSLDFIVIDGLRFGFKSIGF